MGSPFPKTTAQRGRDKMHAPAEHHKHHKLTGAECGSDVSGATGRRFAVKHDNGIGSE
jgi:hypothetical protein